jgi:Flp pilus assembly protein CpaB
VNPTLIFLLYALAMVAVVLAVISVSLWRGSQLGADASQQAQDRADDPVPVSYTHLTLPTID